jgi:hypothetical protein
MIPVYQSSSADPYPFAAAKLFPVHEKYKLTFFIVLDPSFFVSLFPENYILLQK